MDRSLLPLFVRHSGSRSSIPVSRFAMPQLGLWHGGFLGALFAHPSPTFLYTGARLLSGRSSAGRPSPRWAPLGGISPNMFLEPFADRIQAHNQARCVLD